MATRDESQGAFEELYQRRLRDLPAATWSGPGDLGRMSVEAMVSAREDPRALRSHGAIRLAGAGVIHHSAGLNDVGTVAIGWQKCVTAMGAALEGARSVVGRISDSVVQRTQLILNAEPQAGSIVLDVSPLADALNEAYPQGQARLMDVPRPLADQASESLLGLLALATDVGPDVDELGDELLRLGPRVAASVRKLAETLDGAHFDLEAAWMEPEHPTRRILLRAGDAGWLRDFVAGRELDSEEQALTGTLHTISDIAKWSVETDEGIHLVDARLLDAEVVRSLHVGQGVSLRVLVRVTEKPDGTSARTFKATGVVVDELDA